MFTPPNDPNTGWGSSSDWDVRNSGEFYNYLRSVLKPKYLVYLDSRGGLTGLTGSEKTILDGLESDWIRFAIPTSNTFRNMLKTGGDKVVDKINNLKNLQWTAVTTHARYLIGDDVMNVLRQSLPAKYILYLDGASPSGTGLSAEEKTLLDNFMSNPRNWSDAFPLNQLISQQDTPGSENWMRFSETWNQRYGPGPTTVDQVYQGQPQSQVQTPSVTPGSVPMPSGAAGQQGMDLTNIPGVDTFDPTQGVPLGEVAGGLQQPVRTGGEVDDTVDDTANNTVDDTGGVADGVTTMPGTTEPVDSGIPTAWEEAAAEMYPGYWAVVQSIPEIAQLLKDAYDNEWEVGGAKFTAALQATNWWKTTTASARQWDTASALDPATYATYVTNQAAAIQQQSLGLGIRLSDKTSRDLALNALRFGWDETLLTNAIGQAALEAGAQGFAQLSEGAYGQQMRAYMRQYGVQLAETTFNSFLNKVAVGQESLDSFQDYTLSLAKTLYPALTAQFDSGRTFEDVTSGFRQIAANTLEIDPESIDFTDPMWATAVTYQPDPATGEQRLMNLQEWGNYLRNTSSFGYEYTEQAKSRAYEVVNRLANLFGRV